MAHYTSKYKQLAFYVGDTQHKFSNGEFATDDKAVIAVLDALKDAVKTDEAPAPKPKAAPKKPQAKPKEA